MSGIIYRAVERKIYDFSGLAASQTSTIVGAKALDLSQFREANIIARLHAAPNITWPNGVTWPLNASFVISARIDAPTSEDPADFLGAADLNSVTFAQASDTPPAVKAFMLSGGGSQTWGAWLRIYVKGMTNTTAPGAGGFQVMLSVDVNGKS